VVCSCEWGVPNDCRTWHFTSICFTNDLQIKTGKKKHVLHAELNQWCFGRGSIFPHGFRSLKAAGNHSFGSEGKRRCFAVGPQLAASLAGRFADDDA